VTRAELQWLAGERLREARGLLNLRCWSGAYHVAGYVVECGLKACIIKYLMTTDRFPERKFSEQCWTHDLERLVVLASLKAQRDADATADRILNANWVIIRDWDETSRYTRKTKKQAVGLYNAIAERKHGVLAWIKSHW
jgi:HEPN domain-containing protein